MLAPLGSVCICNSAHKRGTVGQNRWCWGSSSVCHLCDIILVKGVTGCCPPVTSCLGFPLTGELASLSSCTGFCCGVLCSDVPLGAMECHQCPHLGSQQNCSGSQDYGMDTRQEMGLAHVVVCGHNLSNRMGTKGTERGTLYLVWGQEIPTLSWDFEEYVQFICIALIKDMFSSMNYSLKGRTSFMGYCKTHYRWVWRLFFKILFSRSQGFSDIFLVLQSVFCKFGNPVCRVILSPLSWFCSLRRELCVFKEQCRKSPAACCVAR